MISFLSYLVAMVIALTGLLFTFLMVIISFIIGGLTTLAIVALLYYIGKEIVKAIYDRIY